MKEELKLFVQKAMEDKELQDKLAACKNPEAASAAASAAVGCAV